MTTALTQVGRRASCSSRREGPVWRSTAPHSHSRRQSSPPGSHERDTSSEHPRCSVDHMPGRLDRRAGAGGPRTGLVPLHGDGCPTHFTNNGTQNDEPRKDQACLTAWITRPQSPPLKASLAVLNSWQANRRSSRPYGEGHPPATVSPTSRPTLTRDDRSVPLRRPNEGPCRAYRADLSAAHQARY